MSQDELYLYYQILTDCWQAFRQFGETHDLGQWNNRMGQIRDKYSPYEFYADLAMAFLKPVAKEAEKIREEMKKE